MKNILKLLLVLLVVGSVACGTGDRTKYVLSETVEVQYYDTLGANDWISIDGMRFEHLENYELLLEDSLSEGRLYEFDVLPTTIQVLTIPGAGEKEFGSTQGPSLQALELFRHLAVKDDGEGNQTYKFEGTSLDIAKGKLTIMRNDGKKIKVSTSEGYGAAIRSKK